MEPVHSVVSQRYRMPSKQQGTFSQQLPLNSNTMDKFQDSPMAVAIIGGGAAGMSCALWLKQLGYIPHIIEHNAKLGGQLLHINRTNRWVLGLPNRASAELATLYAEHVRNEAIATRCNSKLIAATATATATGYDLIIEDLAQTAQRLSVRAIMIATGVRMLAHEIFSGVPGFQPLYDTGLVSFAPTDHLENLAGLQGKTVAVIGGGDNAHFTAKDTALAGARTFLLMRSRPKARNTIRKEVEALIGQGLIIEHTETQVCAFQRQQSGIEITLLKPDAVMERIRADLIFARTGFAANTEFLDDFECFSGIAKISGYLHTDPLKRTSIPQVYAIGDVANPRHQSVVSAIADGAIAAQDVDERV
ncbi:MAG: NAD(P)/FAD-dependent oxidoreductase [Methylovulum sp.]|nr:NAD(P)/FAD-dependent oxidoreductase [Methylovulum sp.]